MIFLFILNLIASAESVEHKAHVHGSAKVGIAFEGAMGKLTFEAPGLGLFGFEHVAKKSKDLQKQKEMLKVLQNKIGDMFVFSKNINCTFGKEKININQEDGHSDVDASFDINCEKDPMGTTLTVNVQKIFPAIEDVDVQVLVGDVQKTAKAKKNGTKIELKK